MRRQSVGRVHRRWMVWAIAAGALMSGCASDPAPKAPCRGPWVWLPACCAPQIRPAGGHIPSAGGNSPPLPPDGGGRSTAPGEPVPGRSIAGRSPAAPQVPVPHGD